MLTENQQPPNVHESDSDDELMDAGPVFEEDHTAPVTHFQQQDYLALFADDQVAF